MQQLEWEHIFHFFLMEKNANKIISVNFRWFLFTLVRNQNLKLVTTIFPDLWIGIVSIQYIKNFSHIKAQAHFTYEYTLLCVWTYILRNFLFPFTVHM
jgi:hypothetical protein